MVQYSNFNSKYNVPMQALSGQSVPSGVPMQGPAVDQVKETVNNSHIANRVNASEESPYKLPLIAATWYGLNKAADSFNRNCSGNFDETVLGKAGKFGDDVTAKIKNTRVGAFLVKVRDKAKIKLDNLTGKNKVLNALKNHSTKPEWGFARMPYEGLNGFISMDIHSLLDDFMKPIHERGPLALEQFGVPKAEIDRIADSLKGLSKAEKSEKLIIEELKALGVKPQNIQKKLQQSGVEGLYETARKLKIRRLGFTETNFAKWSANNYDNAELLFDALKKADKNLKISAWRNETVAGSKKIGSVVSNLFGRQVTISELKNKLAVALGKTNVKSSLGKALQKSLGWLEEGITGRFGGGKFIPLMFAGILADTIISSVKAPKGEHLSTFTDRTFNDFSYAFSMPLGVMILHKLGGMKYAGLDKAGVEDFRKARQQLINDLNAGKFKTFKEFKTAKKAVSGKLGKGFFPAIGKLLNIGNEALPTYRFNKLSSFCKNAVGVPLRVILVVGVLSPFISKMFTKLSHAIFGRPTKSVLDSEEESPDEAIEAQNNELKPTTQITTQTTQTTPVVHNSPTNLLNMHMNGQTYQNTTTNITNNNIVTNTNEKRNNEVLEPVRTYIPSPEGVKIAGEDDSAAKAAMLRADMAEKLALETLNMH